MVKRILGSLLHQEGEKDSRFSTSLGGWKRFWYSTAPSWWKRFCKGLFALLWELNKCL
ncbi:hypothetical protein MA16_Dca001871 [Dendrobium catenatum]|uniref:Uncharacterized protein n=1 Tax=Dendrobium catenatum TaxID=906689 RepID=A0A2I0XDR8_9ASPA|nr:hypothetical protein MA16_Dca001871 [Dendrobium catenatum]